MTTPLPAATSSTKALPAPQHSVGLLDRLNDIVGLPAPLFTGKPSQSHDDRSWDGKIGRHTHTVVGLVAATAQTATLEQTRRLVHEQVTLTAVQRDLGRLDRARQRITGLVMQYMTAHLPPAPCVLLGRERAAGGGRTDLTWDSPTAGVFYDEIKTGRHDPARLDADTTGQINRYMDAGLEEFGIRFGGVRLLTLGDLGACTWYSPDGLVEPLHASPLSGPALALAGVA